MSKSYAHFSDLPCTTGCILCSGKLTLWSAACEGAFQKLKELLIEASIPNIDCSLLLDTDASKMRLGAVLTQKQEEGTMRPVAYANRTFQPHEQNYGATEH
jgi:hypothetical protein